MVIAIRSRSLLALGAAVAIVSCSRDARRDGESQKRPHAGSATALQRFDFGRPLEALHTDAAGVAARVGSFSWEAQVTWSIEKPGVAPLKAVERHRVRQLATGEFEVSADIDPGAGPGSETGKYVVFTGGMTYARGRWAPYRERPTDRGRDARQFRDDSFRIAADLADLYGPALAASPAGETTFLGRHARRYRLALSGSVPAAAAAPAGLPAGGYDPDTKRHVAFLDGRIPTAATGELILDADSGVPLSVAVRGSFAQKDDPQLRADVDLSAQVGSMGRDVPAVRPPKNALADERKPKGVARALEAAGLRKRSDAERAPVDEDEPAEE